MDVLVLEKMVLHLEAGKEARIISTERERCMNYLRVGIAVLCQGASDDVPVNKLATIDTTLMMEEGIDHHVRSITTKKR